jgi:hypothetical protein
MNGPVPIGFFAKFSPISSAAFLADHVAAIHIGDVAQESGDRILQRDLQRRLVERFDLVEGRVIIGKRGSRLVARPLERIRGVVGREFAVAMVALHAGADLERPFGAGRVRCPALGQIGLDEFRADPAGSHADETVEHPVQQTLVRRGRSDVRIELAGIGGAHADDQTLLLRKDRRHEHQRCAHDAENNLFHVLALLKVSDCRR